MMLKLTIKKSIAVITVSVFLAVIITGACRQRVGTQNTDDFTHLLPGYVKDSIYLSPANRFSMEKAALGRYFFYDRRMSVNQTKSCSSCHDPAFSFTDGYRRSIGALGDNVQHNAPALINLVFNKYLTAADSTLHFPEQQISNPMFHSNPVELGWAGNEQLITARLRKDSFYSNRLPKLFPDGDAFSLTNIQACISSFVKTILSFNSPYDRYAYNKDSTALSTSQLRGMKLFFSAALHCRDCHGGINFSVPVQTDNNGQPAYYQNTGLYNINNGGAYPENDRGLFEYSRRTEDIGKYRVPTLRNLAFTAPYLHDGTAADLSEVIAVYESGGRNIITGKNKGDGRRQLNKSPLLQGFVLKEQERKDLIGFLLSLSDSSVCRSKAYGNPFTKDETHPGY